MSSPHFELEGAKAKKRGPPLSPFYTNNETLDMNKIKTS